MKETRRDFMKAALYAGVGASVKATSLHAAIGEDASVRRRPNILLLFPDQWRFDWMSYNPHLPIRTPNLDRLARRGTRFNSAIVAAPVCGPSRACLASGMEYEHARTPNNAVNYPVGLATFYKKLRDSGYHVLGCGKMDLAKGADWWGGDGKWRVKKWGFTDGINNAGKWDQLGGLNLNDGKPPDPYLSFLASRGLLNEHVQDYKARGKSAYGSTFPTPLPDDAYSDNWVTENGFKLLDAAPDKPWFLQVNWPGPHDPEDITVSMEKSVRGRRMPPINGKDKFSPQENQLIRQNYTAMCENIDRRVGMFLDRLEATGQVENTLVLFSSDHGEMLGDHGRWGKSVPYQPSASVPMLIAGPGVQQGVQNSALVSSIDLTATILDYGGVSQGGIDGKTLRPVLEGKTQSHRRVVYSGLGAWRMAFDGQYKVITGFDPERGVDGIHKAKSVGGGNGAEMSKYEPEVLARPPMVFDLAKDPTETRDISHSMPDAARALLKDLSAGNYPA